MCYFGKAKLRYVTFWQGPGHLFFADPDLNVFLNTYLAAFSMRIRIQFSKICTKLPSIEFAGVEKNPKRLLKSKNHEAGPNF